MDFTRVNQGNVVVVILSGRLDAAGAGDFDVYMEHCRNEEPCCNYVIDMTEVSYLSSAVLRIFTRIAKQLESEKGRLVFFGMQSFCEEVLRVTGLINVLKTFERQDDAVEFCRTHSIPGVNTASQGPGESVNTAYGEYKFLPQSESPAGLSICGEIANIQHAQLSAPVIHGCKFNTIRNSFGVGAIGGVSSEYLQAQGNMLTFDGRLFWTPGNTLSPDYLFPDEEQLEKIMLQSGFNLALNGSINELIRFNAHGTAGGAELGVIVRDLLHLTGKRHPQFKGMIWVSMVINSGPVYMQSLKRAPLSAFTPENGKMIDHPDNLESWYDADQLPSMREGVALVCGVAADLMRDLSDYSEFMLERVFRLNPVSLGGKDCLIHNSAALFRNAGYNHETKDLYAEAGRIGDTGELVRVGELQERSHIRQAIIGLSLIDELEMPEQLDVLFNQRLDHRLNRAKTLLDTYGV